MNSSRPGPALILGCILWAPSIAGAQQILPLEQAIRTALLHNPSMASAEASASAAAASRWADWGAFLPTASASASVSRTDFSTITFQNPDGTTTVLDQALDDVNKNNSTGLNFGLRLGADQFANLGAGGARREAADYRLAATSSDVVRQVKVAYFDALKAQALVGVADRQAQARRQDFEVTRDRYRIAAASRSDLLGAEIDLRNAELRAMDAADAFVAAVRQLRATLGQDVSGITASELVLVDPERIPDAGGLDPDRLVAAARSANPDLQAFAADERAASASVWSARASYFPTLNFGLNLGRGRQVGADESLFTFSPANTTRNVTISASWSLFNGFQRKRQNAEASSQLAQARANLAAEELRLDREVRDLVDRLQRRSRRLEMLERNAELADERLELAREQYRLGSIAYFNLQQAIESLDQAQQDVLDERYELLKDWAELEQRVATSTAGSGPGQ
ncbi:MAG: TolC family protein [Gemmatimonadota bacterium]